MIRLNSSLFTCSQYLFGAFNAYLNHRFTFFQRLAVDSSITKCCLLSSEHKDYFWLSTVAYSVYFSFLIIYFSLTISISCKLPSKAHGKRNFWDLIWIFMYTSLSSWVFFFTSIIEMCWILLLQTPIAIYFIPFHQCPIQPRKLKMQI